MERLIANLTGKPRRERLHGRSYVVVPMTLIVPGVLDGSDGPLYYPPEEISLNHSMWDGMPLVGYHPMKEGLPVSARNPMILDSQGFGFVFNSHVTESGSLQGEGWFDEVLTNAFDSKLELKHRIIPRLWRGEPVELSTGVFVSKKDPTPGVSPKGVPYARVARGLRADHIAVLPDQVGACSVKDGCGVLVTNHRPHDPIDDRRSTMPLTPEQRKSHIDFLMANCSCWKGAGSDQILNSIPDEKLVEMHADAAKHVPPPTPAPLNLSPQQIDQLAEVLKAKLQPAPATNPNPTPPAVTPPAPAPAPVANTVPVAQPLTSEQWLSAAPPQIKAMFQEGLQAQAVERQRLADALVANVADPVMKQQRHALLMTKGLDDLRLMAALLPTANQGGNPINPNLPFLQPNPVIHLGGGASTGGVGQNLYPADGSEEGLLLVQNMDWGRRPSEARRQADATRPQKDDVTGTAVTQMN